MSQRAIFRAFLLTLLSACAAIPAAGQSRIGLVISPSTIEVPQGGMSTLVTAQISTFVGTTAPTGGRLSFNALPVGVTTVPDPVTYGFAAGQSVATVTFRLVAMPGAVPGTYYEIGVDASPFQAFAMITVVVLPVAPTVGSLSVDVGLSRVKVCGGGEAVANTVTVSPVGGYRGTPVVRFSDVPAGILISPPAVDLPPLPPAATGTFRVSALAGTPPGSYQVKVVARDSDGLAPGDQTFFTVEVLQPDFAPSLDPAQLTLGPGAAPVNVSTAIAPGACSPPGFITVTPSGLPSGVTVTPSSTILSAPDFSPAPFAFAAAADAPAGTATATFTYTGSNGLVKTAALPVTVRPLGTLAVSLEKARLALCPGGGAAQNGVTVTPGGGYDGSPVLSFPDLPAGLTISPASISLGRVPPARTATFAVSAEPGAAPGERTVQVLVADQLGPSATTTFTVVVNPADFTPVFTPPLLPLNAGGPSGSIGVSISPGSCRPTTAITVAPTGIPAGFAVTPSSAVLQPPDFAPAAFAVQAAGSAPSGSTPIPFTFTPQGGTATTANAAVVICGPPPAPSAPRIAPDGSPTGPVTATDWLALSWGAPTFPFPVTRYEWRINGGAWTAASDTRALAPPRGKVDPVQLFVRGYACVPEVGPGIEGSSPVYSLAPPVADFSVPGSVFVGVPVTLTDASSPQATSWLWFPGEGMPALTSQSPTVTYTSSGPKVVVLIATNGSGSSTKTKTVNVFPPASMVAVRGSVTRSLDVQPDGRLALDRVDVGAGTTLVLRRLSGEGEAVAFLRLVDGDGRVVAERRLVVAAGEEARNDLSAFARGTYRVELVGPEGLEAVVESREVPTGGAEVPVTPRTPLR